MRRLYAALISAVLLVSCSSDDVSVRTCPADYVSTLCGTLSDHSFSNGNVYPATALPWGMHSWSPMTSDKAEGWFYRYEAHKITGFKQAHQPSPWIGDYGQIAIMPLRNTDDYPADRRASLFSHKNEQAKPYLYSVYLADHDIRIEIAPSERAAAIRLTYPESGESGFVLDALSPRSEVSIEDGLITGRTDNNCGGVPDNFANYFVVKSSKPVTSFNVEGDDAIAGFGGTGRGEQVTLYIASSFISPEQARRNLLEVEGRSFDEVRDAAKDRWNEVLGRIEVSGGSEEQMRTFYSCLYRAALFPRKFYEIDADGRPVHYSPFNGEVRPGTLYTDSGSWDVFRAQCPLLNLVYPETASEIIESYAGIARENDFLPEWASPGHRNCMIGNNSASIVADGIVKGLSNLSKELEDTLFATIVHGCTNVHPEIPSSGRLGHEYYDSLGYIPCDAGIRESVARTLEYAYNDWCIYRLGEALGRSESETAPFKSRSGNYRNVFDPATRLMRGRLSDGSFEPEFSPYKWGGVFTEGNAWHYSWSVLHDVEGLISLMGGKDGFTEMLDSVFVVPPVYDDSYYGRRIHEIAEMQAADMGNYAHGNQPAQHIIYLYDYAGQPHKAQYWVREVMDRLYSCAPDGYCGDEDNGQTSAWYVFSALGFYPVCPISGEYAIGSPLFTKATLHLSNGRNVTIKARDNSPANRYISVARKNGRRFDGHFVSYEELMDGVRLDFRMSSRPDTE